MFTCSKIAGQSSDCLAFEIICVTRRKATAAFSKQKIARKAQLALALAFIAESIEE